VSAAIAGVEETLQLVPGGARTKKEKGGEKEWRRYKNGPDKKRGERCSGGKFEVSL